jgi:hypothetical protein
LRERRLKKFVIENVFGNDLPRVARASQPRAE